VTTPADPDPALGATIRRLRKERGQTLESLAFKVGCSVSAWGRIERGQVNATWSNIRKAVKALELTFTEFGQALDETEHTEDQTGSQGPPATRRPAT
jgi:transcriptional regulator with XRE-family HTH domain